MKRTILITGANRGIGRFIAEQLLRDGHRISLGLRDPGSLNDTILDPNMYKSNNIMLNKYDAKIELDAQKWVNNSINKFKKIDTIIHCAGIFHKTGLIFEANERKNIDELLETNVMGPWFLTKAAWNQISEDGSGRIIALISMSGKRSKGNLAGYSMSKFALMGLCQTMRNEGWEKGIRVSTINPGWVNTDMAANVKSISKNEMTQPQDIASLVSKILTMPNTCVPFEVNLNCILEK